MSTDANNFAPLRNYLENLRITDIENLIASLNLTLSTAQNTNIETRFLNIQVALNNFLPRWDALCTTSPGNISRLARAHEDLVETFLHQNNYDTILMELDIFLPILNRIVAIQTELPATLSDSPVVATYPDPSYLGTSALASSFESNPTNQGSRQIQLLKKYIGVIHDVYCSALVYYAPFVPIIQSSGYGKSKVCFEILRECPGIPIVYRGGVSGYPLEKDWMYSFFQFVFVLNRNSLDDLPEVDMLSSRQAIRYTSGRFLIALDTLVAAYIAWFDRLRRTSALTIPEAIETIGNYFLSDVQTWGDSENETILFDTSDNRSVTQVLTSITASIDSFIGTNGSKTDTRHPLDIPFIFVFDEITQIDKSITNRNRVSAVNIIRRGLHVLYNKTKVLALGLGTNSDVVGFMPVVRNNSLRYPEQCNLLPPLILSRNYDIFLDQAQWPRLDLTRGLLLNPRMFNLLVSMGRPLWSSYLIPSAVGCANTKIRNGDGDPSDAILSTWLIRCSLNVNPSHIVTRTLVNSHMATVYYVSSDGRTMKVKYPSEPILALGAREFLRTIDLSVRTGRLRSFDCLLDFIRQRAVDKGRFTEVIFEQIVLFGMDDAPSVPLSSPSEVELENDMLRNIFNARSFVSEILSQQVQAAPQQPPGVGNAQYKVVLAQALLSTLFSEFNLFSEFIPPSMLNCLTNCSHFVTISRDRYNVMGSWIDIESADIIMEEEDEDEEEEEEVFKLRPANDFTDDCDVIDRSLLKIGLMRQCAYVMPENYHGIDYFIPSALEEQTRPGRAGLRNSPRDTLRPLYSFIPCQVKAGNTLIHDAVVKMALQFHLCRCYDHEVCSVETCPGLTTDEEMDLICKDQLAILFCGDLDFTASYSLFNVTYATKTISEDSDETALDYIKEIFGDSVGVLKIAYPSFSKSVSLRDSGNAPDIIIIKRISENVAVEIMKWFQVGKDHDYTLTCIISAKVDTFAHLIGRNTVDVAYNIINYDSLVFDDVDYIHLPLTMDAVINSSHADFPNVDRQTTMARGRVPPYTDVPDSLSHYNIASLRQSLNRSIARNPN